MNNEIIQSTPHMPSRKVVVLIGLLLVVSLACNLPVMAKQTSQENEPGFIETSIAETMTVMEEDQPQVVEGQSGDEEQLSPPTATLTPEDTGTATLTPTATDTPTPEVALVYVSQNTNCRTGQGTGFEWLTSLQAGTEAEAVGVDTSGEYWYIRRPDQTSSFCWLWGKYATPSGPYQSLPVYTPMPTPTPGFDFKVTYYNKVGPCPSTGLQYRIDNIGAFTLESWETSATDHTGGSNPTVTQYDAFVEFSPACGFVNIQQDLTPGESYYVVMVFTGDPTGHDITTKIKICTKNGLAGKCLTKTIRHKP
jgi:hypothetical protein